MRALYSSRNDESQIRSARLCCAVLCCGVSTYLAWCAEQSPEPCESRFFCNISPPRRALPTLLWSSFVTAELREAGCLPCAKGYTGAPEHSMEMLGRARARSGALNAPILVDITTTPARLLIREHSRAVNTCLSSRSMPPSAFLRGPLACWQN